MKALQYLFGPAFKHIFAIIIIIFAFAMLAFGDLSETGNTRMEDLAAMVVGYYFLASMSGSKKDEVMEKMVDNQKQLVDSAVIPTATIPAEDVIRSGDPVTVIKE